MLSCDDDDDDDDFDVVDDVADDLEVCLVASCEQLEKDATVALAGDVGCLFHHHQVLVHCLLCGLLSLLFQWRCSCRLSLCSLWNWSCCLTMNRMSCHHHRMRKM